MMTTRGCRTDSCQQEFPRHHELHLAPVPTILAAALPHMKGKLGDQQAVEALILHEAQLGVPAVEAQQLFLNVNFLSGPSRPNGPPRCLDVRRRNVPYIAIHHKNDKQN